MLRRVLDTRLLWLVVGLVGGFLLSGLLPYTPIRAVATDRIDTFAIATGPVDSEFEAVYFLDFLTGDLRAAVLGKNAGQFMAYFNYNVIQDLGVDPTKNPKFLMVTGMASLRRGAARLQPSLSVVYVAEVTTGNVAAYAIPWSPAVHNANRPIIEALVPVAVTKFRPAAARD
ncbi:MAG: hypothetical protein U1E05_20140 [Patescibacteria group bacterium]|nr:hypothetical protein [Patescibacteria group bacterium]